ncbi:MAG: sigma-54-dependent Fis family transcriptional regulator [Desulfobulbaceae bacterium]|nr:sigma-54-dependent Fis family transcriptional regulator [Desulfobulbaceae bacterium]
MTDSLYPSFKILIVDDEEAWLRTMEVTLAVSGGINNTISCQDGREVMNILKTEDVGLVLLDLNMPHIPGEILLHDITEQYPEVAVIIVSGMNQVETAVSCMDAGAFYFFIKTVDEQRLVKGVRNAINILELQRESLEIKNRFLTDKLECPEIFAEIITQNTSMRSIFKYIEAIAKGSRPVLIVGESGVGKELFARAFHRATGKMGTMISVNAAGLDDNVFADTLFGHVKGAFTGAEDNRKGLVDQAQDGTLFLDEIGDLSLASQIKLLRLLQEGEYYQMGSDRVQRTNARIIVATNHDLKAKQKSGEFRKDLYYRLRAHLIDIPPLRKRKNDIPLLLDFFLQEAAKDFDKNKPTIPKQLYTLLKSYHFPGNIRELKAMVYDAVGTHKEKVLSMSLFKKNMDLEEPENTHCNFSETDDTFTYFNQHSPLPPLGRVEELLVEEALERSEGNQSIASKLLGISQPALSKRLKKIRDAKTSS